MACGLVGCPGEPSEDETEGSAGGGASVPAPSCAEHEVFAGDGACVAVGVTSCPPGFQQHDGGCDVVLPEQDCPEGQMALPGETTCHAIADCGEAPWGEIDRDANTQHVDAAYPNTDSDGTEARPWRTIQSAVDAAADGATIAVAAGTYGEVAIQGRGLVLWGRCPDLVTIAADEDAGSLFAIDVFDGAHGTVIRGVGVTGALVPIGITDAHEVLVDRVHIFDTAFYGFDVEDANGAASVTLTSSLIEGATAAGVFVAGMDSELTVVDTVVRNTRSGGIDGSGRGIDVEEDARITVRGSVIRNSIGAAVSASPGTIALERSFVSEVAEHNRTGRGINVEDGILSCVDSAVTNTVEAGILLLSSVGDVTGCTVREVVGPEEGGAQARGVGVQDGSLTISDSVIANSDDMGLLIIDSSATVRRTIVRDVHAGIDDLFGDGIGVVNGTRASTADLTMVLVLRAERAGVAVFGSQASISDTRLSCNAIDLNAQSLGLEAMLSDIGGNVCDCMGEVHDCAAKSVVLQAPAPPT